MIQISDEAFAAFAGQLCAEHIRSQHAGRVSRGLRLAGALLGVDRSEVYALLAKEIGGAEALSEPWAEDPAAQRVLAVLCTWAASTLPIGEWPVAGLLARLIDEQDPQAWDLVCARIGLGKAWKGLVDEVLARDPALSYGNAVSRAHRIVEDIHARRQGSPS